MNSESAIRIQSSNDAPDGDQPRREGGPPNGPGAPQPARPPRPLTSLLVLFAVIALIWVVITGSGQRAEQVSIDEFKNYYHTLIQLYDRLDQQRMAEEAAAEARLPLRRGRRGRCRVLEM